MRGRELSVVSDLDQMERPLEFLEKRFSRQEQFQKTSYYFQGLYRSSSHFPFF